MTSSLHKLNLCEIKEWQHSGYRDSNAVKYIFANLSDASYKLGIQDKQATLRRAKLDKEYTIVPEFTDVDATTFYDHDCKKWIIVFRGTDIKNTLGRRANDLYTDLALAAGYLTSTARYKKAIQLFHRVANRASAHGGKANIILSGHSLGGRIAGGISQQFGVPAITYNEGSSPFDWKYNKTENKLTTHFTTNSLSNITLDPLSFASQLPGYSTGKHTIAMNDRSWYDIVTKGPLYDPRSDDESKGTHSIAGFAQGAL